MLRTRREPLARRIHKPAVDVSTSRFYAFTDLTIRAVSALGLLALGIAGWWFQFSITTEREEREATERASRIQLASLRVLLDLEFAARDAANTLDNLPPDPKKRLGIETKVASRLESAAAACEVVNADLRTAISLPPPFVGPAPKPVELSVSATTYTLVEVLRILADAETRSGTDDGQVSVAYGEDWRSRVIVTYEDRRTVRLGFPRDEIASVWEAWQGSAGKHHVAGLRAYAPAFARAIQQQAIRGQLRMLASHPEFGDSYVTMRAATRSADF